MQATTHLTLPYLMPAQAQKHVTHNEALRLLDAIVQLSVLDRDRTSPPGSPSEGDRHIVASGAIGDWEGWDLDVALFADGAWTRFVPGPGWLAYVEDEAALMIWTGSTWATIEGAGGEAEFDGLGIRVSPDATNRLAVKSDGAFFSHDDVTPGTGDMRILLNKAAGGNSASFIFQTDWTGHAEFGLTGGDFFTLKVSDDGNDWIDAIQVTPENGRVRLAERLEVGRLGTHDANPLEFQTNGTVRMRIGSAGNVGIGTASPLGALHVNGAGANQIFVSRGGTDVWRLIIGSLGHLRFGTTNDAGGGADNLFTIGRDGRVGIRADANAAERLDVDGNVIADDYLTHSRVADISSGERALDRLSNIAEWCRKDGSIDYEKHYAYRACKRPVVDEETGEETGEETVHALSMETRVATLEQMVWELSRELVKAKG